MTDTHMTPSGATDTSMPPPPPPENEEAEGGAEAAPDPESGPQRLNAATILGTETPAFNELLNREVEFLTGLMYGAHNKRNTLDGQWTPVKMPLLSLIQGFDQTAESPEFGFSRHTASKKKEGPCIVLGSSIDGARQAKAMKTMHFLGIDIDSGARLEDVKKRLLGKGIFCLVHTSFNHGKCGLTLKRDVVLQKLGIKTDPTLEQVHQYLREFDKNRYEEAFIQDVRIDDPKKQEKEGVVIVLDTPPLDKFRLIFPLAQPVEIIELAETHQGALEVWEDAVTGMAHKVLGVHFDTSCTDPSRLFFTSRHPKGSKDWASCIIMGDPLAFDAIPRVKKSSYTKNRELNAFIEAGGDEAASEVPEVLLPSGASLNEWHSKIGKSRFNIAFALETLCPDRIRVAGGEREGTVHTECPFEHAHTTEGGTATMARNPDANDRGYWSWGCHHDACQHRHKTELLGEAIAQGWFDESVLTDEEWLLPLSDEELAEAEVREQLATTAGSQTLAEGLSQDSSDDEIQEVVARAVAAGAGTSEKGRAIDAIAAATPWTKHQVRKLFAEETSKADKARRKKAADEGGIMSVDSDHDMMVDHARGGIIAANDGNPQLFHFVDAPAYLRTDAGGETRIVAITSRDKLKARINKVARFGKAKDGKGAMRHVPAPNDVVNDLLHDDLSYLPSLKGIKATPFFDAEKRLVVAEGYHAGSGTILKLPEGFTMSEVAEMPTGEDVAEAKRLLVEEVFGDFPLGGVSREKLVSGDMTEAEAASLTHGVAATLLPFCREMIDGPTPGHLINKPDPGTGASLFTDVLSIIATGSQTPAMAMPTTEEEVGKTLTATLSNGRDIVFIDNINHDLDDGALASAITAGVYEARILGQSATVQCEVRCAWIFTGNNVQMTQELVRRFILIWLDANCENPEARTGFRHANLRRWALENRGQLVWACLTLIQNWVAKGAEPARHHMGSFESWAEVMGGILRDAGFSGFLANREAMASGSKIDLPAGVQDLLDAIAVLPEGALLKADSWEVKGGNGAPVYSIRGLLNREKRPTPDGEKEPRGRGTGTVELTDAEGADNVLAGLGSDPIIIDGWGFSDHQNEYRTGNRFSKPWAALASKSHVAWDERSKREVRLKFAGHMDVNRRPYWALVKEPVD